MRGYSRAQLADLVREIGLPQALHNVQPEQIDDGELYRWWAKAQTALKEIDNLVSNCHET